LFTDVIATRDILKISAVKKSEILKMFIFLTAPKIQKKNK